MSKTKRYTHAILGVFVMSVLFTYNLPSEPVLASPLSAGLNASESNTNTTTSGSTNTTSATAAISENISGTLENATTALDNATAGLINATKALQDISNRSVQQPANNATVVNGTGALQSLVESPLPYAFILVIFIIMLVPLVLDILLAYHRKSKGTSTDKENGRIEGMPGLYRSLMTFGVILLVGTVIFYILALITLNINSSSPVLQSLIDLLKNLGAILGTALATIIAFYFGVRGAESASEKAVAAATKAAGEKTPPRVLNTVPADGATGVLVTSLISVTFSEPMSGPTINENTFTVRKDGERDPIKGNRTLSPDSRTAIFDPEPDLLPGTKYIAEIDIGATDLAGNALVSAKRWSFMTKS